MTQNSEELKKREKLLKAIMYIAVFLVVFVVLAIGEAYDNPLGIAIYCLGTTLIFQFLILDYVPPEETKRFILIIGVATILGVIVASRSINILSILASVAGVVGAIKFYQILNRRSVSAKASK